MDDSKEKWYDTYEGSRLIAFGFVGFVIILACILFGYFFQKAAAELESENKAKELVMSRYFHSDIIVDRAYLGGVKYDVLTDRGLYVVELSSDSTKVLKALPKPKE